MNRKLRDDLVWILFLALCLVLLLISAPFARALFIDENPYYGPYVSIEARRK